jgi:hypothetical protein
MQFTDSEKRLLRGLNRPSHQFNFHLAAALVMLAGGVLHAFEGIKAHNQADLWLGCLVGVIAVFWTERLLYNRMQRRLIGKLLRRNPGEAGGEHHELFF